MTSPASASYQTAPLNMVSDIIMVDSEVKRTFRAAVKRYLQNPDEATEKYISSMLEQWKDQYAKIQQMPNNGLIGNDVYQHAKNLADAAQVGLQALKKLKDKDQPSADWTNEKLARLKPAKTVYAETELAVIPEIEALVNQKLAAEPKDYPMF